jgi:ABC-type nitrate/sulfonate/bicarbonate transport system permease component
MALDLDHAPADPIGPPEPARPPAARPPSLRRAAARGGPAAVLGLALLATWEVAVGLLDVPAYLVPAPSAVWRALGELRSSLPGHLGATLAAALLGLAGSAVAGVAVAVAIRTVGLVRRALYPLLVVSQTIPMVVLAPVLIVWFGFGLAPKVGVVVLIGFFPVAVSTVDALDAADPDVLDVVASMGAGRRALLRHVLLPAALPGFFAGLTIAAAYAVVGAVVAEWMGAQAGLGLLVDRSAASFRVDRVFAAVAVVSALSVGLFGGVRLLARLTMPWLAAGEEDR